MEIGIEHREACDATSLGKGLSGGKQLITDKDAETFLGY